MCPAVLRRRLLLCGMIAATSGLLLNGQEAPKPEQTPIRTLHVYTNLIQVPTLVLSTARTPMPPIAANRFRISVDSGPQFRPTHVRQEGDDPISLAILLDEEGTPDDVVRKVDDAIANLAPLSLHAHDHVSIYSLGCSLIRSLNDAPVSQDILKRGVDSVLLQWTARREKKHVPACKPTVQLRDAMAFIVKELSEVPGRRVVLALTDGSDLGSKETWGGVRILAQSAGVAIFGLAYVPYQSGLRMGPGYDREFNPVCELSGGMVVTTDRSDMGPTLKGILKDVRKRYIVEFPRPSNSTAGYHNLLVTIEKKAAFIRPSGVSLPIADPAVLADPTTVPSDPSLAPVQGTRRVLANPN